MAGKHEAGPLGSAAREATASPYVGKRRGPGRTLEFHFGAITHQHMLSMANAEGNAVIGAGGAQGMVKAALQAKAVGMNIRKPGVKVNVNNKPKIGMEFQN